jgi:hypothetical protein
MKINKILAGGLMMAFVSISALASAQYYDQYNYSNNYNSYGYGQNNYAYNYNQPYGVTSFNGGSNNGSTYDPYYTNNNYNYNNNYNSGYNYNYNNNYVAPNVSVATPNYYNYNNNYNQNYNYNYNYQTLTPTTYAATYVTSNAGTINGNISMTTSNSYYTNNYGTAWFQYGTSYAGLNSSSVPAAIYGNTNINANLSGLVCGTTYYFRAVAQSSYNSGLQYGATLSFTTPSCYNNYSNYYPNNYNNGYYGNVTSSATRCTYGYKKKRYY